MIQKGKLINLYYDNEEKVKEIELDTSERFIKDFKDIGIDATVIEILPKDGIDKDHFLIPPVYYMFNFNDLINKKILVLQYPKGDLSFSEGKIKEINKENNYEFTYLSSTESGSSGSPIFLKDSIKIIGIHKSGKPDNSENYGDFIGPIFQYFKNFSKNKEALNLVINDDIYR